MELCYANNPKSLFRKYAHLVTWLAQTRLGRAYLGIPSHFNDISLLLPNGYRRSDGRWHESTFRSRAIYAPKLYPALARLDLVQQWLKDFKEAQQLLAWQVGFTRNMPALARSAMFQTTFNPDAHEEDTSVDGHVVSQTIENTWAGIHDGDGTSANDTGTYEGQPILSSTGASQKWASWRRGVFLFDSSALPDTDVISGAVVRVYVGALGDNFNQGVDIVDTSPISNVALEAADWGNVGSAVQATALDLGDITTGILNSWTLNGTGILSISKTSITKFGQSFTSDTADTPPAWQASTTVYTNVVLADHANTTRHPELVVTHVPGAVGITSRRLLVGHGA